MLQEVYTESVMSRIAVIQTLQHPIYKSPPWRKPHEVLDYRFDGAVLFRAIPSTCICRDCFNRNGDGIKGLGPQLAGVPSSLITECLYACVNPQVTQISGGANV